MPGIEILCLRQIVSGVPRLIDKDMVREPVSMIKNGKPARPSSVVPEMIKAVGEEGDMITELINQVIEEGDIPAEWRLSTIVNCCKEKGHSIER